MKLFTKLFEVKREKQALPSFEVAVAVYTRWWGPSVVA